MISLIDAVQEAILAKQISLVTDYEVYLLARQIVKAGEGAGQPIKRPLKAWDAARTRQLLSRMRARQFVAPDPDFHSGVWRVLQSEKPSTAAEAACIADPYCYVSDWSALDIHGLTAQKSETLQLTRPARPVWSAMRDDQVAADVERREFQDAVSLFIRPSFLDTLRRRPVTIRETRDPLRTVQIEGARIRVAAIGDALAATLAGPALCGGMAHVLSVWDAHAQAHLPTIIEAVDRETAKIVKVRAGYILTERLGLSDPRIDAWRRYAQRGGSRRLDPDAPYCPVFSEAWMLSLNVEA